MARYIFEFKQSDNEGYIHTKRVYPDKDSAIAQSNAALQGQGEFEYMIIRKVKVGNVVTVKSKETK